MYARTCYLMLFAFVTKDSSASILDFASTALLFEKGLKIKLRFERYHVKWIVSLHKIRFQEQRWQAQMITVLLSQQ